LQIVFLAGSGFGAQGRHLLPATVIVPLLAGHIVSGHSERLPRRFWAITMPVVGVLVAGVQFAGWYYNSKRNAVGVRGSRWFFSDSQWSPPLGWYPWLSVAAVAVVLMITAVVRSSLTAAPADAGLDEVVDVAV
jgi:hypothetical protein